MKTLLTYLLHVLVAIDQLGTTLIGGYPDETLSSYAHRLYVKGRPMGFMRHVINGLFFWQKDHCMDAYYSEVNRRQLPPIFRD